MGTGLASRFSLAISRVIDNTGTESSEDVNEIVQLVNEINAHQDLTVKLNNQSKICNIFSKGSKAKITDKRVMDPEIIELMDKCRRELESLQADKEAAVDEFLESHTEERLMGLKRIKK